MSPPRLIVVLATALAALLVTPAVGQRGEMGHLHNARYCEILVLKGAPPTGKVVVWNTIGLNRCPAKKWESLDSQQLAQELGATAVILNGPRFFVLDRAKGRTGPERSFDGLHARRVATLPIRTSADLARTPYADRVVERHNVWHWRAGRRVYELLAPNGSNYVMQAYSQIVDPQEKIGDLASLGDRLDLPPGWRYRVRRLRRPLDLKASGPVRIIQDELQNTYQKLPRRKRETRNRPVFVTGTTKTTGSPQPGTLDDRGTTLGSPFGRSSVSLLARFGPGNTMTGTFKLHNTRGSVFGTVDTTYVVADGHITFDGTAEITGGTKSYRGIKAKGLRLHDRNTLDGQNGVLTLSGSARF